MKIMLSANQQWRQSGSVLPFKDWLNREKAKGEIIPQEGVLNFIEQEILDKVSEKKVNSVAENKNNAPKNKTLLGLNLNVLIISSVIILGALTYKYYKKK
jgi:hypothetical protein